VTHSVLHGHRDRINAVAISPDGQIALSGANDNTCILWNLDKGITTEVSGSHLRDLDNMSITQDGKQAIFATMNPTFGFYQCMAWDLKESKTIQTLGGHAGNGRISALAITPNGQRAISGTDIPGGYGTGDGVLYLWDLTDGCLSKKLTGHSHSITAVSISPCGARAISGSRDGTCIIWNLKQGELLQTLKGHGQYNFGKMFTSFHSPYVDSIVHLPDGKVGVFGTFGLGSRIWNVINGMSLDKAVPFRIGKSCISPDGKLALSVSMDKSCILWDLRTGQIRQVLKGHEGHISCISISPDGKRAISGSSDGTCFIWDLETGNKLSDIIIASRVKSVTFLLNGILLGSQFGEIINLNAKRDLLCPGIPNTTIKQIWDFELKKFTQPLGYCPLCGHRFAPPASVLDTIDGITRKAGLTPDQSPCLELPDEAWEEPGLLSSCPKCGEKLKFNPFIAGGD
jgi:WD40 repeat protein